MGVAAAASLPPLREDLRLHEVAPGRDGEPAWSIQDPVTNRFYRIGWLEFECLLRWPGDPAAIADDIARTTPLAADKELVEDFARFLAQHHLVRPSTQEVERLAAQASGTGWRHWRWWLHNYLFVRVPLVRPDRWLAALLPLMRPLMSLAGLVAVLLASGLGVVLVARQWDSFTHGVMDILTPSGILGFAVAIVISKTLHEMGHALVATRLGVRVAHMGVAFVVLWPMLYTDTSESWRLRSHRQRLAISVAGISVELALAGLSTLAWALMDDGPMRQAMLYLATTGWVLSLALNVSPFMRFDGYFILSDLLDFPNLHERSGAAARAWMRRTLLGWDEPDPEPLTPRLRRWLVAFALFTWLYRLVVFAGIAVAVYLMFFKVLGIFLFIVEIAWFIVRPMWSEIVVWRKRWAEVKPNRRAAMLGLGLTALVLLSVPWALDVDAPGMARPERQQAIYGPFAARVTAVHPPGAVPAGTPLVQFEAPDLLARETRTGASVQALSQHLAGLVAAEDRGMEQQQASTERLREQLAEAHSIREETGRLQMVAEFDGLWVDTDPAVRPGTWVGTRNQLGMLIDPSRWIVEAYVDQRQLERIRVGASARFRPQQHWQSLSATVVSIDSARAARLTSAALDATHGGPIATQPGERQGVPVDALYRVRLALAEPLADQRETRGHVTIEGTRRSLAWQMVQRTASVVVREAGF
ncbi:MAG: HlyD family efflux transporter periplasmic adaptor subunit [Burkholderiaceae bacterium]|nr:MAG: HlyD family efflux transporter periplasmic adaptor subunit [Burkholderiaceae bacterium]